MAGRQARVILLGDLENSAAPVGIERPDQLAKVPRDFRGYLWVEDIYEVGPALRR
jgi:glycerophosphoryl diester phosphodiesterase